MTGADILECIETIKTKSCEGYDRITQRILSDGAEFLVIPCTGLFWSIYNLKKIPEKWSTTKVMPIHQKGLKCDNENYHPTANLFFSL